MFRWMVTVTEEVYLVTSISTGYRHGHIHTTSSILLLTPDPDVPSVSRSGACQRVPGPFWFPRRRKVFTVSQTYLYFSPKVNIPQIKVYVLYPLLTFYHVPYFSYYF